MHANQQQKNPDYLLGTINALRAQVKQINTTIATLEECIQARPEVDRIASRGRTDPPAGLRTARASTFLQRPHRSLRRHLQDASQNWTLPFRLDFKNALTAELAKAKKPSKRGYIAATPQELYPGNPKLWKYAKEIAPGWMLGTNESSEKKLKFIRLACKVIGLRWGKDLKIYFQGSDNHWDENLR